jgi:hypothetical protein
MKKIKKTKENKKLTELTLKLKEKEQELDIEKQRAGFFSRKHAEALRKLERKKK